MEDFNRDSDYQDYFPQQRPRKKRSGLLAVLVVLALVAGAVTALNLQVDLRQLIWPEQVDEAMTAQPAPQQMLPVEVDEEREVESSLAVARSPQSVENRPAEESDALSLQQIYEKVSPSVASISCVRQSGTGTGTGIVMSRDGYVITNFHVIENAHKIYALLDGNLSYEAELVGGDETTDIAVLKVEASNLVPAEFGDSDVLRVGDAVVAIGDPLGTELRGTMTDGIVSAINRDLNLSGRQMTLIQTNAALNSGNSGGPLINCYGQVIGINTMKMSNYSATSATVEGLGFAIPITSAKPVIDDLIAQGYVSGRPAIGIQGQTLDLRAQLFYRLPSGVMVTGILEESDAAQQGLDVDDIIVAFDGTPISSLEDLVRAKSDRLAGETVQLTIYRSGNYYHVDVVLVDQIRPEIY